MTRIPEFLCITTIIRLPLVESNRGQPSSKIYQATSGALEPMAIRMDNINVEKIAVNFKCIMSHITLLNLLLLHNYNNIRSVIQLVMCFKTLYFLVVVNVLDFLAHIFHTKH